MLYFEGNFSKSYSLQLLDKTLHLPVMEDWKAQSIQGIINWVSWCTTINQNLFHIPILNLIILKNVADMKKVIN